MSVAGPLARIVAELDRCGIPHMVAGSFASMLHGVPRMTHDIDLVIDPTRAALDLLVRSASPERFYLSQEAAAEAWRRRGQFNVIDLESGWKADLIIRKHRPFSVSEFGRRQPTEILSVRVFAATAEDTILAKLEWAKLGESERQVRDVIGILEVRGPVLDRAYIESWTAELGVTSLWERAQREAESS